MKQEFANEMAFLSLGAMAGCVLTDCEKYGMCFGCDQYCPVLKAGKCENEDSIEMYKDLIEE